MNEALPDNSILLQRLTAALKLDTVSQSHLGRLLPLFSQDADTHWMDRRQMAYALATSYHETGKLQTVGGKRIVVRFAPVAETRANAKRQPGLYARQNRYWNTGFYGRGLVQITWRDNYETFQAITGKPLLAQPALALELDTAYVILREGMLRGLFTSMRLSHYIHGARCDYVNARRVINGTDRAAEIAAVARTIQVVLLPS
jgi:predicted chitinase